MRDLIKQITDITKLIEIEYPELYQYLDENPITLSRRKHPKVDEEVMREYLNSLQILLDNHRRSR